MSPYPDCLAYIIRRLEGKTIEVLFPKPVEPGSPTEAQLAEFAKRPEVHLIRSGGQISGVQCSEQDYLRFLMDTGASKEVIQRARAALDDSKKARRERMRG